MSEQPEITASDATVPEAAISEARRFEAKAFEVIGANASAHEVSVPETSASEAKPTEETIADAAGPEAKPSQEMIPDATHEVGVVEVKLPEPPARDSKMLNRPFRVKLRGSVLVLVRLPNRRDVRAAIHQLSTTGGVIHFEKPLDEKIIVELIFHIGTSTIREKAQMLFPMWATQGWMQPFRFIDVSDAGRELLDTSLKTFLGDAKGAAAGK